MNWDDFSPPLFCSIIKKFPVLMCDIRGKPPSDSYNSITSATSGIFCTLETDLDVVPPLVGDGSVENPLQLEPCAVDGQFFAWNGTDHICATMRGIAPIETFWNGTEWEISEESCTIYRVPIAYPTIQSAIDTINSTNPNQTATILLCPGGYLESFTLPRNTYLMSTTPTIRSSTSIVGNITLPAGGGRTGIAGMQISSANPNASVLDASASIQSVLLTDVNLSNSIVATVPALVAGGGNLNLRHTNVAGNGGPSAVQLSGSAALTSLDCAYDSNINVGITLSGGATYDGTNDTFLSSSIILSGTSRIIIDGCRFISPLAVPFIIDNSTIPTINGFTVLCTNCTFQENSGGNELIQHNTAGTLMQLSFCTFRNNTATNLKTGAGDVDYSALAPFVTPTTFLGGTNTNTGLIP